MDPITVIVAALTYAGTKLGDKVIQDGYAGLKALIVRKFAAKSPELAAHVDALPQDPSRKAATEDALRRAGADHDQETVDRATALLKTLETRSPGSTNGLVGTINNLGGKVVVAQNITTLNMGD